MFLLLQVNRLMVILSSKFDVDGFAIIGVNINDNVIETNDQTQI